MEPALSRPRPAVLRGPTPPTPPPAEVPGWYDEDAQPFNDATFAEGDERVAD